jgi:hypothetical protein
MGPQERLVQLRTQAFQRIEEAAKKGHTDEVKRLGQVPKECEDAMELLQILESQIEQIEAELRRSDAQPQVGKPHAKGEMTKAATQTRSQVSPRQKANEVRMVYVNDLSNKLGNRLRRKGEVIYETQSGKSVGMPYASELPELPDRWWLGLPDEHFDYVVLLCETGSGELLDFVFPSAFVMEVWNSLSRDSKRHVKLNVFRSGVDYELRLNDGERKKIRRFLKGGKVLI